MTDREQLAARIEAADASDKGVWKLLEDAFLLMFPQPAEGLDATSPAWAAWDAWADRKKRFWKLLDAEANLDAAMMLVDKDMDQTALTGLIVGAAEECYAQCGDLRKDLPRFLAAAAIRAGGSHV